MSTFRVVESRLKRVMRERRIATQAALFNALLDEEVERITTKKALERAAGKLGRKDFDDRLL